MSTGSICVPSPCMLTGDPRGCQDSWCCERKEQPMTLNNIYSAGYLTSQYIPIVFGGVGQIVQTQTSDWFFRIIIIMTIPYTAMFLTLIIALMVAGTVSIWVGILLIILLLLLVVVSIAWIAHDIETTISTVDTQVRASVTSNWDANLTTFERDMITALGPNVASLTCTGSECPEFSVVCSGCLPPASRFCSGCVQQSIFCAGENPPELVNSFNEALSQLTNLEDIATLKERYRQLGATNCTTCAGPQ